MQKHAYKAVIFDLDGVICHTDEYHYQAWKQIADELGIYFDRAINSRLRGVSRKESFEIILERFDGTMSEAEKEQWIEKKNEVYKGFLAQMRPADLSDSVKKTLDRLREQGLRLAIGSSSKNAGLILGRLGLGAFFDAVSDGNNITHSKPHPEVFLKAADYLGEKAEDCLVVEDAEAGLEAARAAGMDSAAIGDAALTELGTWKLTEFADLYDIVCGQGRTRCRTTAEQPFLRRLLESISVSGYEEPLQDVVKAEMDPEADEIRQDEMGNVVCVLNPDSRERIMLSAHADEIGLMVSNIREDGRIQAIERGGIVPATYPGQQVRIRHGEEDVYGVAEGTRKIFREEQLSAKHFLIDIGAADKKDAERKVSLGDPVVLDTQIRRLENGRISARALDDRIGVYVIMQALKRAKEMGCRTGVYAASTVGEETTKNGAYWTSSRIKPTMAVVVDVTYTCDTSEYEVGETGPVRLGEGPVLCNSPIVVKGLNRKMEQAAEQAGIHVQREAASRLSYTDADQIHFSNQGVPTVLVSVPLRYMHMPAEVVDLKDVDDCIELIAEFLCGCA